MKSINLRYFQLIRVEKSYWKKVNSVTTGINRSIIMQTYRQTELVSATYRRHFSHNVTLQIIFRFHVIIEFISAPFSPIRF